MVTSTSIVERDALVGNLLDRLDELERRIRYLEDTHPGVGGEAAGKLAYYREDGSLHMPGLLYSEENAVWGYYHQLASQVVNADSPAGVVQLIHPTVPAGEVWTVQGVTVYDSATAATCQLIVCFAGANQYLYDFGALTINLYKTLSPITVVLKAGDYALLQFQGCTLHDFLISNLWGYKMKVS